MHQFGNINNDGKMEMRAQIWLYLEVEFVRVDPNRSLDDLDAHGRLGAGETKNQKSHSV